MVQQVMFEAPEEGWCVKSAGPTNPPSKDAAGRQIGGRLYAYDCFTGVGTGRPSVNEDPHGEDITGQAVRNDYPAKNWLGTAAPPPDDEEPGEDPPPPPPATDPELKAMVLSLLQTQANMNVQIGILAGEVATLKRLAEQQDRRREELAIHVDQVIEAQADRIDGTVRSGAGCKSPLRR
jgi:hypothetical protein